MPTALTYWENFTHWNTFLCTRLHTITPTWSRHSDIISQTRFYTMTTTLFPWQRMVKSTCLTLKLSLLYSHKSMASALGYTKLACTSTQPNTTYPKVCPKLFVLETLLKQWDMSPSKNITICGSTHFANIRFLSHIGLTSTKLRNLSRSKLLKWYMRITKSKKILMTGTTSQWQHNSQIPLLQHTI